MADITCQVCGDTYPTGTVQCERDGNPLVGQRATAAPNAVQHGADRNDAETAVGAPGNAPGTIAFRLSGSGVDVTVTDEVRIGRDPIWSPLASQLADRDVVSGRHATVRVRDGRLLVTDEGSTNGTLIDGQPCQPGELREAPPGSTLRLSSELVLTVHADPDGVAM